jgi:hypothetical protein
MPTKGIVIMLSFLLLSACGGDDNNSSNGNTQTFNAFARAAFAKPSNGVPEVVNGRNLDQGAPTRADYDDLLSSGSQ